MNPMQLNATDNSYPRRSASASLKLDDGFDLTAVIGERLSEAFCLGLIEANGSGRFFKCCTMVIRGVLPRPH